MNLSDLLRQRASEDKPLRVALIGAGKFGSMFLAQARRTPGIHVVAVADLDPRRAHGSLERVGWTGERTGARSFDEARRKGTTCVTDDAAAAIASDATEIVIDATGSPAAGIRHALACCKHGKHVVMVNVEADCLAGPLLARRAREAGIIYSLAYGGLASLQEPIRADYFGTKAFATIQGVSRSVTTAGTFMGPIIAGFLYDLTKSYTLAFAIFAVVSLGSAFCMFLAKPPARRKLE